MLLERTSGEPEELIVCLSMEWTSHSSYMHSPLDAVGASSIYNYSLEKSGKTFPALVVFPGKRRHFPLATGEILGPVSISVLCTREKITGI